MWWTGSQRPISRQLETRLASGGQARRHVDQMHSGPWLSAILSSISLLGVLPQWAYLSLRGASEALVRVSDHWQRVRTLNRWTSHQVM